MRLVERVREPSTMTLKLGLVWKQIGSHLVLCGNEPDGSKLSSTTKATG